MCRLFSRGDDVFPIARGAVIVFSIPQSADECESHFVGWENNSDSKNDLHEIRTQSENSSIGSVISLANFVQQIVAHVLH